MQGACAVLCCHLWPVWLHHIFPHYLMNVTIFGEKKLLNIKRMFFSVQLSKKFSFKGEFSDMYLSLYVKYLLFLSEFNDTLEKYSYIKFHENPSIGSRVFPRGRTDRQTDIHTNMT